MLRPLQTALIFAMILASPSCRAQGLVKTFDGEKAFSFAEKVVSFGQRIPGTEGSKQARDYILNALRENGLDCEEQKFTAETPIGSVEMTNVIARLGRPVSESGKAIVIGAHYDTKMIDGVHFVGANDAASAVGILIELSRLLKPSMIKNTALFVFFDGEESFKEKKVTDWFYGSRNFVRSVLRDGQIGSLRAMILLDMVGDSDFTANYDLASSDILLKKTETIAKQMKYGKHFFGKKLFVSDDHIPFKEARVPVLDIIDFEYGGDRSPGYYWHTADDTMDKLSRKTFKIVGDVVLNLVLTLDGEI